MAPGRAAWLLCAVAAVGCRAQAVVGSGDGGVDLGAASDLHVPDDGGPVDLAGADLRCAGPAGPEVCGNGCDDDRNGYVDDDDPACTLQVLYTEPGAGAAPALKRLILEPTPHALVFDGNPLPVGPSGVAYRRAFSPSIYLTKESAISQIRRIDPAAGGSGTVSDFTPSWSSGVARDVCVFNGELIVVERYPAVLHRFKADGQTELAMIPLGSGLAATSCASDGNRLYVAVHDTVMPSSFLVFDQALQPAGTVALPDPLLADGLDRCLDFAWTERGLFVGLFTASNGTFADALLNASQLYPFALDGGVGAPIDAGLLHSIGELAP